MSLSYQSRNSKKELLVFDFDGVLADSFNSFFPLIKDAMESIDINLTEKQYRDFFSGNVHHGFENFIKDENKYSVFSKFRNKNYNKYLKNVCFFPGAVKVLKKLSRNHILTIASSSKQDYILKLLKKNRVDKLFGAFLATTDHSKENMIKEILAKFKVLPPKTIMITDTVGDIKIAKKIGLKTVAVIWGFHSTKTLRSSKPDFIADNFNELANYLN